MRPPSEISVSLRLLFVEDNEDARAPMTELLEMCGHSVVAVGTAEAALEQLQPGRFDVVLTDISLPGMSGVDLARSARSIDPRLRIIAASGYGNTGCAVGDFDVVLTKPYDFETLEQTLLGPPAGRP